MAIDELQKQLETIQDGFVRSVIFPGRAGLERINTVQHKSAAGQQCSRAGGIRGTPQHL